MTTMTQMLETEKKVLASGIQIKYLANEFLFRQGQKAEFVFYLQCGSILLEWPNENKSVVINNKPIFIGIDEALVGGKYACTALTTEQSEFLVFDRAYFNQLINEFEHAKDYFESMRLDFTSQLDLKTIH
jgi:CRP-like cAMP-binding protein